MRVLLTSAGLETEEKRGKLTQPLKEQPRLTNICALLIRDLADGMEIVGE